MYRRSLSNKVAFQQPSASASQGNMDNVKLAIYGIRYYLYKNKKVFLPSAAYHMVL